MKKVVIIGATSGIGRSLAKQYAARGYQVGVTGRRQELLNSLQQKFPANILTACFDITSADASEHIEELVSRLQGMDIFIYNAGYGDTSKPLNWEIENTTISTNVTGFAVACNYAFNYLADKPGGQIVGISSIASIRGSGWAPAYSASKAFMSNYLEGLHLKAKALKSNIAVTDIQPGYVDTSMAKSDRKFWVATPDKAAAEIIDSIDRKKFRVYITRRWALVAYVLRNIPGWYYRKVF